MRVLIFEHLCGGGARGESLAGDTPSSGLAMWRALVDDFQAAGHEVVTTLDERLTDRAGDAETIIVHRREGLEDRLRQLADRVDAVVVIAPENRGILLSWYEALSQAPCRWLGCGRQAIELCADKYALARHWREHHVPTPPTFLVSACSSMKYMDEDASSRWVIKPRFGMGCEATRIQNSPLLSERSEDHEPMIAQPYMEGLAASVALIVHDEQARTLLPGRQLIERAERLVYTGGQVPLRDDWSHRAKTIARRATEGIPGLHGYIGVDLVLGKDASQDRAIEINPRLTMSYIALRRLCKTNLATAMLDSCAPLTWREQRLRFDAAGRVEGIAPEAVSAQP